MFQPDSEQALASFVRESTGLTAHTNCGGVDGATAVDLGGLNQLIDYPAADMTITAGSGMTVATLQAILAEQNQHLPIDVADPESTTIGDAVARDVSGPRRFGYGTLRDYVIGLSAVDGNGRLFRSGGRVVKNVAGYDLCKLLTGSHGTLAILTQLTLKVRPVCERTAGVCIAFATADLLEEALESLPRSETRPVVQDVSVSPGGGIRLYLVFDGSDGEVQWQLDQISSEIATNARDDLSASEVSDYLVSAAELALPRPGESRFRAGVRPSRLKKLVEFVRDRRVIMHAGNGIVFGTVMPGLEPMVAELGGWYISLGADGNPLTPGSAATMMQKVKQAFDPRGVLNPHIRIEAA